MKTYEELNAEHSRLLRLYSRLPHAPVEGGELDMALRDVEHAMLDNAPPYCGKGLVREPVVGLPLKTVAFDQTGIPLIDERDMEDAIQQARKYRARAKDHVHHILNQKTFGACASGALNGAGLIVREKMNQARVIFNMLGMYGRVNGGRDNGSALSDNLAFAQKYGMFPESAWPFSNGWKAEPSDEAYAAAADYKILEVVQVPRGDLQMLKSGVIAGHPGYFGYDSHAVVMVEILDKLRCGFLNDWWVGGQPWGDGGFGTLSFSSIVWDFEVYLILNAIRETPGG